jgi:hypothetical protein
MGSITMPGVELRRSSPLVPSPLPMPIGLPNGLRSLNVLNTLPHTPLSALATAAAAVASLEVMLAAGCEIELIEGGGGLFWWR